MISLTRLFGLEIYYNTYLQLPTSTPYSSLQRNLEALSPRSQAIHTSSMYSTDEESPQRLPLAGTALPHSPMLGLSLEERMRQVQEKHLSADRFSARLENYSLHDLWKYSVQTKAHMVVKSVSISKRGPRPGM